MRVTARGCQVKARVSVRVIVKYMVLFSARLCVSARLRFKLGVNVGHKLGPCQVQYGLSAQRWRSA